MNTLTRTLQQHKWPYPPSTLIQINWKNSIIQIVTITNLYITAQGEWIVTLENKEYKESRYWFAIKDICNEYVN